MPGVLPTVLSRTKREVFAACSRRSLGVRVEFEVHRGS